MQGSSWNDDSWPKCGLGSWKKLGGEKSWPSSSHIWLPCKEERNPEGWEKLDLYRPCPTTLQGIIQHLWTSPPRSRGCAKNDLLIFDHPPRDHAANLRTLQPRSRGDPADPPWERREILNHEAEDVPDAAFQIPMSSKPGTFFILKRLDRSRKRESAVAAKSFSGQI